MLKVITEDDIAQKLLRFANKINVIFNLSS